jgi:hypothetical protein
LGARYKWNAHQSWQAELNQSAFEGLIKAGKFEQIAATAIRIESRTNLLFSFEKMALRDAVRSPAGAKAFALAPFNLHGPDPMEVRFSNWIDAIGRLRRRQTRVLTWPLYKALLDFVARVRADTSDLRPRDMIDMQSFLWVQGSEEYPD